MRTPEPEVRLARSRAQHATTSVVRSKGQTGSAPPSLCKPTPSGEGAEDDQQNRQAPGACMRVVALADPAVIDGNRDGNMRIQRQAGTAMDNQTLLLTGLSLG